jgi:hypothetical protein
VSTGIHAPSRLIRVGADVTCVVNEPSGFADVVEVCDVSASTATALPDFAAAALAAASLPGVEESATAVSGP